MARYTGPRARVSRRLGTNIWGTKGENKAMEKRPFPPGQHGRTRRRGTASEYSMQLAEKQKARFTYGLNERQFRNLYLEASRREGVTGLNMLQYLELRLDNIVYRAAWAATRPQARQIVSHGHVEVTVLDLITRGAVVGNLRYRHRIAEGVADGHHRGTE